MKYILRMTLGLAVMIFFVFTMPTYGAEDVSRISTEQLNDILDSPDLVILDVRTKKDWEKSDKKIIGAVRVDPDDVSSWAGDFSQEKNIILYCA